MKSLLLALPLLTSAVLAQTTVPAAQKHVKIVDGVGYKYTSKLKTVVELNFTMGYHHASGKPIITSALDRVARGKGFAVRKITGPNNGTAISVPSFTFNDLMTGQVIVANNISMLGSPSLGTVKQQAIQRAIETEGRGYLAFHGSGDNSSNGWAWLTNILHPVSYAGHASRTNVPVYKHLAESKHIVLEGAFQSNTTVATVPNELNSSGGEVLTQAPTRTIKDELHRYGRDISRTAGYQDKVTMLLKYDARNVPETTLPVQYKRKGGNLFSYLYKVGNGMTSYLPSGHDNEDLLSSATGFDGGAGDFDRYLGQMLFFLAGYDKTVCDASCNGLQLVDADNRLVGKIQGSLSGAAFMATTGLDGMEEVQGMHFSDGRMGFASTFEESFRAVLMDVSGKVMAEKSGSGRTYQEFAKTGYKQGIYFLSVRIGQNAVRTKRYVLTHE